MEPGVPSRREIPLWACLLAGIAIVAAAAAMLRWQGRSFLSTTGVVAWWSSDAWGRENSQQLFDPYTFTHITHGVLIYAFVRLVARKLPLRARMLLALALEASWEVYENTDAVIERYRAATMALGYYGDSVFNSVGDILASVAGFALAATLSVRATVLVVIGLEILLALWIRDGLVLNIIMLIHPIEAVKTWQLGLVSTGTDGYFRGLSRLDQPASTEPLRPLLKGEGLRAGSLYREPRHEGTLPCGAAEMKGNEGQERGEQCHKLP